MLDTFRTTNIFRRTVQLEVLTVLEQYLVCKKKVFYDFKIQQVIYGSRMILYCF